MTTSVKDPAHDAVFAQPDAPREARVAIEIDATVETVWRALTDPQELTRWFPTTAEVTPRPGGAFVISWNGQWEWKTTIADWQPLERLRLLDPRATPFDADGRPLAGVPPVSMAIEFTLEARGGRTLVRVVHSGFGHGAAWDDEIDGVSLGWNVELRGLRHYLSRHQGRSRRIAWAHQSCDAPLPDVWRHLTSAEGLVSSGSVSDLHGGDRCTLGLVTGDAIEGTVLFAVPGRQLVVAAENFGDGLFRLSLDRAAGRAMVQVWMSTWQLPEQETQAFEQRIQRALGRALTRFAPVA